MPDQLKRPASGDEFGGGRPAWGGTSNDLSGTILGPSVQAGLIFGGVHLHDGPPEGLLIPRQLPAPPAHFVNRVDELSELDQLAGSDGTSIVVLSGPGGVGKTALAVRWAHGAQGRYPDGQLYADLGAFSDGEPLDPGEVLGRFLRALGVAPRRVPATLVEQVALYRTVTANRSLIVVIDNALTPAQVRVLLPASAMSSVVLVTSRRRLAGLVPDGARLIEVVPLRAQDSLDLLTQTVGRDRIAGEREPAENLAQMCGGLPIALCVAAAQLAARPRLSVQRVVSSLTDEAARLGQMSIEGGPSVQAALDMSYKFLGADAAVLYRRLALHPGPDFGTGPAAVLHDTGGGGSDALGQLVESSLLEELIGNRFRFHDLVRLHAKGKSATEDGEHDRDVALIAMLEWYFAAAHRADLVLTPYRRRLPYTFRTRLADLPRFKDRDEALNWLEQERVNLIHAGRAALEQGHSALAWQLCDVMWPLLLLRKHYRDRLEIDERGVQAARSWRNVWAEADMLKRLGRAYTTLGQHEAAERHTRAAIARFQDAGDPRGRLDAEDGLAMLYQNTGRDEEAVRSYRQLLAANRDLGEHRSIGLTCISLGTLLTRTGRPAEAIPLLNEAGEIFAGLGVTDPYNGVRVRIALAGAYLANGELADAKRVGTEAERRMRDLGSDHERAEALDVLGQIAQRRGDVATARRHYREALRIFTGLDSIRSRDLARQLDQVQDAAPRPASPAPTPPSDPALAGPPDAESGQPPGIEAPADHPE